LSGPKIELTSHLFLKNRLDYLKNLPLFSRMFFDNFGFGFGFEKISSNI
jgi:hypothetical protein